MAEGDVSLSKDQFSCSICLELLKEPVSIPCGHSYCMNCITYYWNQDDQKRNCSCPQCRQIFTTRPFLGKNIMLTEVVEKLKKTKCPDDCYVESGDVECDICTEIKLKAVKSCLVCLNSYCQNHLEQHENFFKGKKHKLIDATERLQQMICTKHEKLLEFYCRTDHLCICYLCMVGTHKNHNIIPAEEERTEKQKQLKEIQSKYQQKIYTRQKEIQELRDAVKNHKSSAQTAVNNTERIFNELILTIRRRRSEMIKMIRDQEKTAVNEAEGLMKKLEQEIDDLSRRDAELEELPHTDDHVHFLQSFESLSVPPESTDSLSFTVSSLFSFDDVQKMKEKLENLWRDKIEKIFDRVTPEPSTREQFLQYYVQFTLDPNTAHKRLRLSKRNRVITNIGTDRLYPDHPERFDECFQVLCKESVNGHCYWEVEWNGKCVDISLSYKSINRKGDDNDCRFGCNDQSWCLSYFGSSFSFWHNTNQTDLPLVSKCSRIGVYVNHSAGILSFYKVSDTMTLIHRVQTTFTQPLYPGFEVNVKTIVKLCDVA